MPVLVDLFCCAGGASEGYSRAGFDVYGVDIADQPRYPFPFIKYDALAALKLLLDGVLIVFRGPDGSTVRLGLDDIDAFAASPPCQGYSDLINRNKNHADWPLLIDPTRELLLRTGKPFIMENVETAPMINPVKLCGTMFPGLRVLRHRLFESNVALIAPAHVGKHPLVFTHDKRKPHYGKLDQFKDFVMVNGGGNCSVAAARDAMGIDWMIKRELNESIPPAYTEFLGLQLIGKL